MENPKLDVSRRYKFLSQRFNSLAFRAANSEDCFEFLDNALLAIEKQMGEKWEGLSANTSHSNVQSTSQMRESFSVATRLKKKENKKMDQREQKPGLTNYTKQTRRPPKKKVLKYATK